jgi:hypothetical protein
MQPRHCEARERETQAKISRTRVARVNSLGAGRRNDRGFALVSPLDLADEQPSGTYSRRGVLPPRHAY